MKLKYTFTVMELDDQIMAIPIGEGADELHGVVKLNDTAAAIFNKLSEETSEDEIVKSLLEEYDISEDELKNFVHEYVGELSEAGLLE